MKKEGRNWNGGKGTRGWMDNGKVIGRGTREKG